MFMLSYKNIDIKTVVLIQPDCVMIWMNWFDAENFFNVRFLRTVVGACCSLFYLTRRERAGGKKKREKRGRTVGECVLLSLLHCAFIYSSKRREDIPSSPRNTIYNRKG